MRPLTDRLPKALLPIAGRPILEYLVDALEARPEISQVLVVVNARFHQQFLDWRDQHRGGTKPLRILNDGSTTNENRLGAIGDLQFALGELGPDRRDDLLVVAGDHIFEIDF